MSALALPIDRGVVELTRVLCEIESVSGNEEPLANRIEATLRSAPHLEVLRHGNTVAARTRLGRDRRVIIAGHIDTVPLGPLTATRLEGETLLGRGSVDMKGGVASHLIHAMTLTAPRYDVTWVFYDQEEVDADRNGLGHFAHAHPDWLVADFGILGEPTGGLIEGGCNGTMRLAVTARGRRAHSARPWKGDNAIHALAPLLERLATFEPETRTVDGLDYRESLQAVGIQGGVAGNVVPDVAMVTVNFRFAPDRSPDQALEYLGALTDGYEVMVVDVSAGARPGLDAPIAQEFMRHVEAPPAPKYGWTDVARLSALGIPAVNFGPGDPSLAHTDGENVPVDQLVNCHASLGAWLSGGR